MGRFGHMGCTRLAGCGGRCFASGSVAGGGTRMLKLKLINAFALQWLGVRLALATSLKNGELVGVYIIGPVLPCSGWFGVYVPANPRTFALWRSRSFKAALRGEGDGKAQG